MFTHIHTNEKTYIKLHDIRSNFVLFNNIHFSYNILHVYVRYVLKVTGN